MPTRVARRVERVLWLPLNRSIWRAFRFASGLQPRRSCLAESAPNEQVGPNQTDRIGSQDAKTSRGCLRAAGPAQPALAYKLATVQSGAQSRPHGHRPRGRQPGRWAAISSRWIAGTARTPNEALPAANAIFGPCLRAPTAPQNVIVVRTPVTNALPTVLFGSFGSGTPPEGRTMYCRSGWMLHHGAICAV